MKDWIDLNGQVQKHVDRGLDLGGIQNSKFAMFLYSSNYYRVSGYGRCFYEAGAERYVAGTTAVQLMDIYDLDRVLRNLILDGVGVVEPTLRSRVAFHVAKVVGGGDAYLKEDLYLPIGPEPAASDVNGRKRWQAEVRNRDKVLESFREIQARDEIFIRHHVNKGDPVPFWAAIEVVSLGTFSRFLRALRDKSVLEPVTKSLQLEDEPKLLQAVQNITFLRNIAAHHGRLWNRRFDGHVTLPAIALKVKRQYLAPKTPAAALTLLAGLVDQIETSTDYSKGLLDLVHSESAFVDGYYRPIL
ncbi:Abi family protein [Paenarthrobacter aromaticivorans]|uniref:Abi family protein n=1 Tax=Paenarthrobacter aromaticivorans TaxID=2849150 RepID=A0ABS6ICY7_9MICC|nr:Abi family protein [Paenarthrobacter sp. MMS21-TAE1-1]MBU8868219.1 Abi family protein [Paenarthrobacter sp. MMS21-TAE1-1]